MRLFEGDWDAAVSDAWRAFRGRLADRIAGLSESDTLVVETAEGEEGDDGRPEATTPYVQLAAFAGGSMLRGEVSSNVYLTGRHRLDRRQESRLVALGWRRPTADSWEAEGEGSTNYYVDLPCRHADRLAVMVVAALREVFGVPHPAFLGGDVPAVDAGAPDRLTDAASGGSPTGRPTAVSEGGEQAPVTPGTAEQLRSLVDDALVPLLGCAPEHDADGDVPVPFGSSLVFVRVRDDVPVVHLFSPVVEDVQDRERASFEVNVLNRDLRFLKFVLVDDRVMAHVHLPAWPFVPEHLRSMLTGMSHHLDVLDEDLAARVGGRVALGPSEGPGTGDDAHGERDADPAAAGSSTELDAALMTLLQLDAEAPGSVTPELAAAVCHDDQVHILRLLRQTEAEEASWARARGAAQSAGEVEEAQACEGELEGWQRTTSLLRRALRLVVEHRPIEDLAGLLRSFAVGDLRALGSKLSSETGLEVSVTDEPDGAWIEVEGLAMHLPFPFTGAAVYEAVAELLADATVEQAPPEPLADVPPEWAPAEFPASERGTCPRCGSEHVRHVVFGMPFLEMLESAPDWVEFAGCVIEREAHTRRCETCGERWTPDG